MDPLDAVSLVLLVLFFANLASMVILLAGAYTHRWPALIERAVVSVALFLTSLAFALLAGARLEHFTLNRDFVTILLLGGVVAACLPAPAWLLQYFMGRFDE